MAVSGAGAVGAGEWAEMLRQGAAQRALAQQKAAVQAGPPPPAPAVQVEKIILVTPLVRGPVHVVVVGCGGTGARLVPPLMKMLRQGDVVSLFDHDIVEDRNLLRQHFTGKDIGMPKSLVLATRYRQEGVRTFAYQQKLTPQNNSEMSALAQEGVRSAGARPTSTIFIGCVDNAAARRGIAQGVRVGQACWGYSPGAWIDVGNEMRAGQVLLTLVNWSVKVVGVDLGYQNANNLNLLGLQTAMPQLLRDTPADSEESCGARLDLQTVQVNHLASAAALNCLSWLLLGIPFTSCGSFFSTLNTMQPIPIVKVDGYHLIPDTSHAVVAAV